MQNTKKQQTKYSLNQAAKLTGKSKGTISKDIKSGKLSADKLESGAFEIDLSELNRAYETTSNETAAASSWKTSKATNENGIENSVLAVKVEFLTEQITDLKQRLEDTQERLENDRDEWKNQAKTLLLQKAETPQTKHSTLILACVVLVVLGLVAAYIFKPF